MSIIYYLQIYLVAENKVLKIYPLRIGTNEAPVEVFFECAEEIIGIAASLSSSCVLINVKNRGLFAYRLYPMMTRTPDLLVRGEASYLGTDLYGFHKGQMPHLEKIHVCYF